MKKPAPTKSKGSARRQASTVPASSNTHAQPPLPCGATLRQAVQEGDAIILTMGGGTPNASPAQQRQALIAAAIAGDADAQSRMGDICRTGDDLTEQDPRTPSSSHAASPSSSSTGRPWQHLSKAFRRRSEPRQLGQRRPPARSAVARWSSVWRSAARTPAVSSGDAGGIPGAKESEMPCKTLGGVIKDFAERGSQRWLQIAAEKRPDVLLDALRTPLGLAGGYTIEWRSP